MLSKRLEISQVYEKWLQNCFDLKTGAISSACTEVYRKNRKKGVMSIFSKTVFVVTKIFRIWTMGDNFPRPYTHVFGKIFVAASVIIVAKIAL